MVNFLIFSSVTSFLKYEYDSLWDFLKNYKISFLLYIKKWLLIDLPNNFKTRVDVEINSQSFIIIW